MEHKQIFIAFQLTNLLQFSTCESTVTYVIVDSHAQNWNNVVNWNDMEEGIPFQLGASPVLNDIMF